jgi:DNA-binding GntR family transcriptional regulator
LADDSSLLAANHKTQRTGVERARAPRGRIDYTPLLDLVGDDGRSPDDDGPAFATHIIRKGIVTGLLKPGDAVRQDLMASALSLSKPPVREALRMLEAEQLVVFLPNRGFVVAPESSAELREAWELRVILEPAVLRIAAPNLTAADFEHARLLETLMQEDREYLRHYEMNLAYHLTLYRPSGRPHFLEAIERAHARCQRYNYKRLLKVNQTENTPIDDRHEVIVDRLEAGDIDGACACLVVHLEEAKERTVKAYQRYEFEDAQIQAAQQKRRRKP